MKKSKKHLTPKGQPCSMAGDALVLRCALVLRFCANRLLLGPAVGAEPQCCAALRGILVPCSSPLRGQLEREMSIDSPPGPAPWDTCERLETHADAHDWSWPRGSGVSYMRYATLTIADVCRLGSVGDKTIDFSAVSTS